MHFCNCLTSGGRIGSFLVLFDLGEATLGASRQGKKTNDETRCGKIAWYLEILQFHCFRWCLAEVLHWHIEVVDALVDVVCAAVLKTCGFTIVLVHRLRTLFTHQPLHPKP